MYNAQAVQDIHSIQIHRPVQDTQAVQIHPGIEKLLDVTCCKQNTMDRLDAFKDSF